MGEPVTTAGAAELIGPASLTCNIIMATQLDKLWLLFSLLFQYIAFLKMAICDCRISRLLTKITIQINVKFKYTECNSCMCRKDNSFVTSFVIMFINNMKLFLKEI